MTSSRTAALLFAHANSPITLQIARVVALAAKKYKKRDPEKAAWWENQRWAIPRFWNPYAGEYQQEPVSQEHISILRDRKFNEEQKSSVDIFVRHMPSHRYSSVPPTKRQRIWRNENVVVKKKGLFTRKKLFNHIKRKKLCPKNQSKSPAGGSRNGSPSN